MNKSDLPASIRRFVDEQDTRPVSELDKVPRSELRSPFSSYWHRAVACVMLSGRVQPKHYDSDGSPNMTEVNRFGKEANFNQYVFERVGRVLATMDIVVERKYGGPYEEGPNIEAFWDHDEKKLPQIGRQAVLKYIKSHAGYLPKRATPVADSHLIEFLTLFFACFQGRAFEEPKLASVLQGFGRLPKEDLVQLAGGLGIKSSAVTPEAWDYWLQLKGGQVIVGAVARIEWMNGQEHNRVFWAFPGDVGLWMLGLGEPLPPYQLPASLEAGPKSTIRAGLGRGRETLVPLFRHCKVKKIDEVCTFELDAKRMAEAPAGTSPGDEIRRALKDLGPLPAGIAKLLETKSQLGGEIAIRGCSALLRIEDPQVLEAIRKHPKLKNYIEPGAPPGYLLIKPGSDPYNFIERSRALGFNVIMEGDSPLWRKPIWVLDPRSR